MTVTKNRSAGQTDPALLAERLERSRTMSGKTTAEANPQANEQTQRVYFHCRCHIQSPTWCYFEGEEIHIVCAECGADIARFRILIAEGGSP